MYITLADIAGKLQYTLPTNPSEVSVRCGGENETVDTLSGLIRLTGSQKLKEISWDCFFPVNKKYSFQEVDSNLDGWDYVDFIETMSKFQIPIRVIVTEDKKTGTAKRTIINELVSIDSFEYKTDKVKDINYSISLTQFPNKIWQFLNTSVIANQYFKNLATQSTARKKLKENGLL